VYYSSLKPYSPVTSFIWLVPSWEPTGDNAVTSYNIMLQDHPDERYKDLAKGAGGAFRYLIPIVSPESGDKIVDIKLLRSEKPVKNPPYGWDNITIDINAGRGGDYLYLIYKTEIENPPAIERKGLHFIKRLPGGMDAARIKPSTSISVTSFKKGASPGIETDYDLCLSLRIRVFSHEGRLPIKIQEDRYDFVSLPSHHCTKITNSSFPT
jgi:hypothetical protein